LEAPPSTIGWVIVSRQHFHIYYLFVDVRFYFNKSFIVLTARNIEVSIVKFFLPHLSMRPPMWKPQKMGGKKVRAAIQERVSSDTGSGAGPSGDCSSGVIGDCHPSSIPKFNTGMVTGNKTLSL
jgi:hypothetical protein